MGVPRPSGLGSERLPGWVQRELLLLDVERRLSLLVSACCRYFRWCGMTTPQLAKAATASGGGSAASALVLDLTSTLDYEAWKIAASFPLGAVMFLACWFLGEQAAK